MMARRPVPGRGDAGLVPWLATLTKTRDDQADRTAELSEAARAAVRDPGDPRIDAHIAALGLGPDPTPSEQPSASLASEASGAEAKALRERVAGLDASLGAARSRARVLAVALAIALAGDAILFLLLVLRPA
jgi:hypothetical protein